MLQTGDYVGSADIGSAYSQTSVGSDLPASGKTINLLCRFVYHTLQDSAISPLVWHGGVIARNVGYVVKKVRHPSAILCNDPGYVIHTHVHMSSV